MASDKARFYVSRSYEVTTRRSARHGDIADQGWIFQDVCMTLGETVAELRTCMELSSMPTRRPADLHGNEWAITEPETCPDGSDRRESVFIVPFDRSPRWPAVLFRLFRLANLTEAPARA